MAWTQLGPNSIELDATRCDETRRGSGEMPEKWTATMGILGILAMPLGLDAEFWRQMG